MVGEPSQHPADAAAPRRRRAQGTGARDAHRRRLGHDRRRDDDTEAWWRTAGELIRRLDDACAGAGRDPATMSRTLSLDAEARYSLASVDAFEEAVGRAAELGYTDVVSHWPREHGLYAGDDAVLDEVAARLPTLR